MKKFLCVLLASAAAATFAGGTNFHNISHAQSGLAEGCKSACLMDARSGEVVFECNAKEHLPIASVCKVMTLTLCFDAVAEGRLGLDDTVTVSEHAAGMGGSQVFLQGGSSYSVSQLIKSIIVCSANDSCVALSETISGSEENFVAAMNDKAEKLGCRDTLFANCTGLPKSPQYSCARDVAVMFANLIRHEEYFDYSKIWLEDFEHPDDRVTTMTNTNKLLRSYPACDGGKTGFTNEAGFCLAATADKDNLRLVSVVLGGGTSDERLEGAVNLFNYGFANYTNKIVLDGTVNLSDELPVSKGKKESIKIRPERNSYVFCAKNDHPEITFNVVTERAVAPLDKGEEVGKIEVYRDGILCDCVPLVCAESAPAANYLDNLRKIADNWPL